MLRAPSSGAQQAPLDDCGAGKNAGARSDGRPRRRAPGDFHLPEHGRPRGPRDPHRRRPARDRHWCVRQRGRRSRSGVHRGQVRDPRMCRGGRDCARTFARGLPGSRAGCAAHGRDAGPRHLSLRDPPVPCAELAVQIAAIDAEDSEEQWRAPCGRAESVWLGRVLMHFMNVAVYGDPSHTRGSARGTLPTAIEKKDVPSVLWASRFSMRLACTIPSGDLLADATTTLLAATAGLDGRFGIVAASQLAVVDVAHLAHAAGGLSAARNMPGESAERTQYWLDACETAMRATENAVGTLSNRNASGGAEMVSDPAVRRMVQETVWFYCHVFGNVVDVLAGTCRDRGFPAAGRPPARPAGHHRRDPHVYGPGVFRAGIGEGDRLVLVQPVVRVPGHLRADRVHRGDIHLPVRVRSAQHPRGVPRADCEATRGCGAVADPRAEDMSCRNRKGHRQRHGQVCQYRDGQYHRANQAVGRYMSHCCRWWGFTGSAKHNKKIAVSFFLSRFVGTTIHFYFYWYSSHPKYTYH